MAKFKSGDIVVLKSGGPKMTIHGIGEFAFEEGALCKWFNEKSELKEAVFDENSLEHYDRNRDPKVPACC